MIFTQWPSWLIRSPTLRRGLIKLRRALWRVERATFAEAILVAVGIEQDRVLAVRVPSGVRLPCRQMDAWVPVATQIEVWITELLPSAPRPALVAVAGTPGRKGITFLYRVEIDESAAPPAGQLWLHRDAALSGLGDRERALAALCLGVTLPNESGG